MASSSSSASGAMSLGIVLLLVGIPRTSGFYYSRAASHLISRAAVRRGLSGRAGVPSILEVEEKFPICDAALPSIREKLEELHYKETHRKEFVDWYFDDPLNSLVRNDCWLRYRELNTGHGRWQLKQGDNDDSQASKSTVYVEKEGEDALIAVRDIINKVKRSEETTQILFRDCSDGEESPTLPSDMAEFCMLPFARIATNRSSWSNADDEQFSGLSVDLDTTDFGYSVGEVEAVVSGSDEVDSARGGIENLVRLLGESGSKYSDDRFPAVGKLEFYLEKEQPKLYNACITFGVIKSV